MTNLKSKPKAADVLRKIIREEIEKALDKKMPIILKELKIIPQTSIKKPLTESLKQKINIPGTLNTKPFNPVKNINFGGNNPMMNLLQETAQTMQAEDFHAMGASDVDSMPGNYFQPEEAEVGSSINEMLSTARGSSQLEMVQINTVPDFTELMGKLKAKGAI